MGVTKRNKAARRGAPRPAVEPAQGGRPVPESTPAALQDAPWAAPLPPEFSSGQAAMSSPAGSPSNSTSSIRGRAPPAARPILNPLAAPLRLENRLRCPRGRVGGNGQENAMEGLAEAVVVAALIVPQSLCPAAWLTSRSACAPVHQMNSSGAHHLMVVSSTQHRGFRF